MGDRELLRRTAELAEAFLDGLDDRPVGRPGGPRGPARGDGRTDAGLGEEPAGGGRGAWRVPPIRGSSATAGPRYFGFVIGGGLPAALAADWLTSAWDQNAGLYAISPAAAVVEEVAPGWLVDLFGLPAGSSRRASRPGRRWRTSRPSPPPATRVLGRAGWDVEERGLFGAPPIDVVVGDEAHVTIFVVAPDARAGPGPGAPGRRRRAGPDAAGRAARRRSRGCDGPTIVCAQAGNVNTGAFDPLPEIAAAVREHGALAPRRRRLRAVGRGLAGAARPDRRPASRRLVDDRRPQVAQRAVRLGARVRPRRGGPPRGDDPRRRVLRRDRGRASATRTTGSPSRRAGRAASRSTPRCGRSGGTAWPR